MYPSKCIYSGLGSKVKAPQITVVNLFSKDFWFEIKILLVEVYGDFIPFPSWHYSHWPLQFLYLKYLLEKNVAQPRLSPSIFLHYNLNSTEFITVLTEGKHNSLPTYLFLRPYCFQLSQSGVGGGGNYSAPASLETILAQHGSDRKGHSGELAWGQIEAVPEPAQQEPQHSSKQEEPLVVLHVSTPVQLHPPASTKAHHSSGYSQPPL